VWCGDELAAPGQRGDRHRPHPGLGTRVLVDDEGRTVYLFVADPPNQSACYGACASLWPPVTTAGKPEPGGGITASKLSTFHRRDGGTQVAYAGHPLYYYQADTEKGDAYGEGLDQFGAEWYALSPSGQQVEPKKGGGGGS
jgi:predicted lipoprotein with Yx(FWY)xxD motif